MKKRIAVIGGGISGLCAAHRLVELSKEREIPIEISLFEKDYRLGGIICTRRKEGFLIEEGPDSFITTKPWALLVSKKLGLESELIHTYSENRRAFVVRNGKLLPIPEGFHMMAPTQIMPFLISPLFSLSGKLRTLIEPLIQSETKEDESLASFVKRRFGKEVLDRVAEPLISGIYTADPEKLSLRATMPQFLEMEKKYGSVIRGMLLEEGDDPDQYRRGTSGARYSHFVSFKDGMDTLVDAIRNHIPREAVKLNRGVESIEKLEKGWNLTTENRAKIYADGIIIATPSYHAAKLVKEFDVDLSEELSEIDYASSAVINLAYRREDISHRLDGFGFVVPAVEGSDIIACSFSSVKFDGRAPDGFVLLRCFAGGAINPECYELEDSEIIEKAKKEIRNLLGAESKPLFTLIHRWEKAMPQYQVGHVDLVRKIEEKTSKHPGLSLAGNAYNGVGIPDCVRSGEKAAEAVIESLTET